MQASSIGGGRIMVNKLDGIDVNFNGMFNTLVIRNQDASGTVAAITSILSQLRINVAKGMLKHGCSVSTAAYASGFNDANYFCTVFHAMVGMSPSRFARHAWPNPADRQPGSLHGPKDGFANKFKNFEKSP